MKLDELRARARDAGFTPDLVAAESGAETITIDRYRNTRDRSTRLTTTIIDDPIARLDPRPDVAKWFDEVYDRATSRVRDVIESGGKLIAELLKEVSESEDWGGREERREAYIRSRRPPPLRARCSKQPVALRIRNSRSKGERRWTRGQRSYRAAA